MAGQVLVLCIQHGTLKTQTHKRIPHSIPPVKFFCRRSEVGERGNCAGWPREGILFSDCPIGQDSPVQSTIGGIYGKNRFIEGFLKVTLRGWLGAAGSARPHPCRVHKDGA